jgi:hypothetical protein
MIRARMRCNAKIADGAGGYEVHLKAIYSGAPGSENQAFSDVSPMADIVMFIGSGKPAAKLFALGQEFYVDFSAAPPKGKNDVQTPDEYLFGGRAPGGLRRDGKYA